MSKGAQGNLGNHRMYELAEALTLTDVWSVCLRLAKAA
ncbi:hypothetical protein ETAA8_31670 [Anatilimnocola aggregata]|uniref:Uncharacterized protein n=1 Tax=Anatilimnocola aggregata TaxID=2528021 RepID=A0A517YCW1_9BACT|nr:hypothetical protein ETAA8_31670 [Anatilimnocola aggregata]